jgi:hypothetical protein
MRVCLPAVLTMVAGFACDSSPVDCSTIPPLLCSGHSQCSPDLVKRIDDQCTIHYLPVRCLAYDRPSCQLEYYIRDPAGTCWLTFECYTPPGWTADHGDACHQDQAALYTACFSDAGADGPAAARDAAAPQP